MTPTFVSPRPLRNGAACLLFLWGLACGDDHRPIDGAVGDSDSDNNDAATDGSSPHDGGATDDGNAPEDAAWAYNLVVAGGESAVQQYLEGASEDVLYPLTQAFYGTFGDEFDFLYLLSPVATGTGRFSSAFGEAMPAIGLTGTSDGSEFGSTGRLQGVVALRLNDSGNGPTLHETLHRWGVFLDDSFGFGRDRDNHFGPHWGVAGLQGQHGGFDPASLTCADGTSLPCGGSGRFRVTVAPFGPAANGGDSLPYAPIELYLMGLTVAADVPSFPILRGASFLEEADGKLLFEVDSVETLSIDDIVAVHGEQPLRSSEARAFRGAFVLVTDVAATDEQMTAVEQWSRVFDGDLDSPSLFSFEDATGGRASMDTTIAIPR